MGGVIMRGLRILGLLLFVAAFTLGARCSGGPNVTYTFGMDGPETIVAGTTGDYGAWFRFGGPYALQWQARNSEARPAGTAIRMLLPGLKGTAEEPILCLLPIDPATGMFPRDETGRFSFTDEAIASTFMFDSVSEGRQATIAVALEGPQDVDPRSPMQIRLDLASQESQPGFDLNQKYDVGGFRIMASTHPDCVGTHKVVYALHNFRADALPQEDPDARVNREIKYVVKEVVDPDTGETVEELHGVATAVHWKNQEPFELVPQPVMEIQRELTITIVPSGVTVSSTRIIQRKAGDEWVYHANDPDGTLWRTLVGSPLYRLVTASLVSIPIVDPAGA